MSHKKIVDFTVTEDLERRFWEKVDKKPGDCWEWMAARLPNHGYGRIANRTPGGWVLLLAHRVSLAIDGRHPRDKLGLHRCDNPPCVNPNHLYVGTNSDNIIDARDRGNWEPPNHEGEKNPSAKLTEKDVVEIRTRYANEHILQRELAEQYSLTQTTLSGIVRGESWKDVGGPIIKRGSGPRKKP